MKPKQRNPIKLSTTLGAMLLSSVLLASCGSSGGSAAVAIINAGIGGTGIVFGTITGFGSVWVNGRRFEIDASEIVFDGAPGTQTDLKLGMVVKLDVDTENGMFGGAAARVIFDDAIQGPVNGAPQVMGGIKRLTILNQQVTIDSTRTLFVDTDFESIGAGDVLEISGFRADPNGIVATYVRKVGSLVPGIITEVELRGRVENLDADNRSFSINGVQIEYTGARKIDVEGGRLEEDMLVEVEGIFVSHASVYAIEIEQEDEAFGTDGDEISLQGIVSGYSPTGAGLDEPFFVNGQKVDASTAELDPENLESLMQNGLEVEVEGEIVNGVLIAEELELRDGDTEVRATVVDKDPSGSFVVEFPVSGPVTQVTITTSGLTVFEDESETPIPNYSFQELAIGDFVEVEGVEVAGIGADDKLSALVVKRRKPNDFKLQGAVDAIDPLVSITILGLTYLVHPTTLYEEDPSVTAAQFFDPAKLMIGDIVEIEDYEPDGLADEAELDD